MFSTRRTPCICHACSTKLYIPWDSTTKEAYIQPRYGKVNNFKYSKILGSHNNWVIMKFLDDGSDNVEYECINRNILDDNVTNTSLISTEVNYGAIDDDDSACHGYYIIIVIHIHIPFKQTRI